MRNTDCKNLRQEIDGAAPGRLRSAFARRHLEECQECRSFSEQTLKLQEILSGLEPIEAPGDFDFRLRARLAGEKPANFHFPLSGFSFGLRGAAVAALLFIFGSALFLGLRTTPESSLTANNVAPVVPTAATKPVPASNAVALGSTASVTEDKGTVAQRPAIRSSKANSSRPTRVGTRELASRPATIIKASDLNASADFPTEASTQAVRMSLDNSKGNSRTISLPPVSFGSQRVMSQGSTPLLASAARGSW